MPGNAMTCVPCGSCLEALCSLSVQQLLASQSCIKRCAYKRSRCKGSKTPPPCAVAGQLVSVGCLKAARRPARLNTLYALAAARGQLRVRAACRL
jgi:hypothetical protein